TPVRSVIATLAVADTVESASLLAATVWVPGVLGGEVNPDALMFPISELPPATESTSQCTVVTELPATVAVKVCVWPVVRATRTGETLTVTEPVAGAVMVIVAEAAFVPSFKEVAVAVTTAGVGAVAGAV